MDSTEQPETPAEQPPGPKPQLPDTRGALPIPEQFRLPLHGKMVTPTSVPSATQRQHNLNRLEKRRRRRGFLLGLLAGQILIIGLDLGGELFLRFNPHIKLQAEIRVASVVFLGMAVGAALLILGVALIYAGLAVRALFGQKSEGIVAAAGSGISRVILTALALGVSIGVIIGTAWFMIPHAQWRPTIRFAEEKGRQGVETSKSTFKSLIGTKPSAK